MTRSELVTELERFATKQDLERELERFATKQDLERELERFATKQDLERFATKQDLERFATKQDLEAWGLRITDVLLAETGRLFRVIEESLRATLGSFDDRYRDLPGRVGRLEDTVFGPDRER